MAQSCHIALKGITAPIVLKDTLGHSSVLGDVGEDDQVSGRLECPLGKYVGKRTRATKEPRHK